MFVVPGGEYVAKGFAAEKIPEVSCCSKLGWKLYSLSRADIRSFAGGNLALPFLFWNRRLSWASFK